VLHLGYVVSIGGDFMAGRFVALPLFGAALLVGVFLEGPRSFWIRGGRALRGARQRRIAPAALEQQQLRRQRRTARAGSSTSAACTSTTSRSSSAKRRRSASPTGRTEPAQPRLPGDAHLRPDGYGRLDLGPYVHLLDECALADPLLAHLPAVYNAEWRTGHYRRIIPAGYKETLETAST
jgi:arabinofuranosyltransferase